MPAYKAGIQLIKLLKGLLDRCEIREIAGGFQDFRIADDPLPVDDEGRAFGDAFHVEYESIVESIIFFGDRFIEIAEQGEVELLVLFVFGEGKDGVDADAEDLGVGLVVEGDVIAGAAKLFCAGAGEGLRKEEQQYVFAFVAAEGYLLLIGIVEGEIRGLLAWLNAHIIYVFLSVAKCMPKISDRGFDTLRFRD